MRKAALLAAILCAAVVALYLLEPEVGGRGGRGAEPDVPVEAARAPAEAAPAAAPSPRWRAVGEVRGDGPVTGAVEIRIEREGDEERLATGAVVDGAFALDLPALAERPEFLRKGASVFAVVVAPGHLPGRCEGLALDERAPGDLRLDVTLERGASIRGRVVDEAGRGVPGAEVWLSPNAVDVRADADQEGRFALPLRAAGAYWLCARKGDLGVAAEGPLQLPLADHEAKDLVLRGPGILKGVVVYPDGTPARELDLNAVPERLRETTISSYPDSPFDAAAEGAAPDGLRWGWTVTDGQGRFLIRGLRAGAYFFLEDDGRALHQTGTEVRVLVDSYRILVRVVDERGLPLRGIGVAARGSGGDSSAGEIRDLRVEPGEQWTIRLGGVDIVPTGAVVDVTADRREYEATLVARPVTERGRLEVRLLDPRGAPLPDPRVSVHALPHGNIIVLEDPASRLPGIPAGEYRVEAIPNDRLAPYFPAEGRATVRAGATASVTLEARAGGRIRVTLKGDVGELPADLRITTRAVPGGADVNFVPLRIREGGGYSIGRDPELGEPVAGWIVLEPGPHEVRVSGTGLRPLALPAHVLAEGTTDVEAVLERE
jgi:hypothetical protein